MRTPALLALLVLGCVSCADAPQPTPNIILTMTDDQGWGDVSYNGHPVLKTPNLDQMAASGLRFDRFYAAHCNCSPTRGSVMSGRHPNRYRAFSWGYDLPLREVTVAEAVKTVGYVTGHFGKWHLGGIPHAPGGSNRGNVAHQPGPPEQTARHPGNQGFDEWFSAGNWFDMNPEHMYHNGQAAGPQQGDTSDIVMQRALAFIRQAARQDQPFLAVIWFPSPHNPHIALETDKAPYLGQPGKPDFYGELAAVDRNMGLLRAELRELGIHRHTMLWFCSDNGAIADGSTGGLSGRKGNLREGGIRVPGILEWPDRIPEPRATAVPATTSDIYPTILDLLGVEMPDQVRPIDGISLLPLIDGEMTRRPKPIAFEVRNHDGEVIETAVVDNDYKLFRERVREKGQQARDQLFHLANDPKEEHDLSGSEAETLTRLQAVREEWQRSVEEDLKAYPEQAEPDN